MCGLNWKMLCASILLFFSTHAAATIIEVAPTYLTGNSWSFYYTITNNTLGTDIEEFSVYFSENDYENLVVLSSPADWDPLVIQPDLLLPSAGFYDALALASGISAGTTLSGFGVQVDFIGAGMPSVDSFSFDIIDPVTFNILESGFTTAMRGVSTAVPEPNVLALMIAGGIAGVCSLRRRKK